MPSNVTVKIVSARSTPKPWLILTISLALCAIVACLALIHHQSGRVTLRAGRKSYALTRATTANQQSKGLGGRAAMPTNQGMLFIFPTPGTECFWMKDMHFSLDMFWLNAHKQVVHIESDVLPSTYPATFCPAVPALYVIELNAGQVKHAGIHVGEALNF